MSTGKGFRHRWLLLVAAAVAMFTIIGAAPASAKKPSGTTTSASCPAFAATGNFKNAGNVGAEASNSGEVTTYTLTSDDEGAVKGVPGLIEYCVYTNDDSLPTLDPQAVGADGAEWLARLKSTDHFSFVRPGGNKTNIAFDQDGKTTTMGTADWGHAAPTGQVIVLHIADGNECRNLYGPDAPSTCFVLPKTGPVCDAGAGNTDAAYNSMPVDVEHCGPPSWGFQARQTAEFGDLVELEITGGGNLQSMTVDFQSYACLAGSWNGDPSNCTDPAGETFTVPITAKLYSLGLDGAVGDVIATATINPYIPYRPAADPGCANPVQFADPVSGECHYSLSVPLEFTGFSFPNGDHTFSDGEQVIWTVQFNTSTWGYSPIGTTGPWDSLNVGVKAYPGAPYAGVDVDPDGWYLNSAVGPGNYCDAGVGGLNTLRANSPCRPGLTPLAEIVTGP